MSLFVVTKMNSNNGIFNSNDILEIFRLISNDTKIIDLADITNCVYYRIQEIQKQLLLSFRTHQTITDANAQTLFQKNYQ